MTGKCPLKERTISKKTVIMDTVKTAKQSHQLRRFVSTFDFYQYELKQYPFNTTLST